MWSPEFAGQGLRSGRPAGFELHFAIAGRPVELVARSVVAKVENPGLSPCFDPYPARLLIYQEILEERVRLEEIDLGLELGWELGLA